MRSAVCHDSRKAGCIYARVQDIARDELECLGLWRHDVLSSHYSQVYTVDACSKLAGFATGASYDVKRAKANPFEIECFKNDPFFENYMKELDDDALTSFLIDEHASGKHYTGYNVYKALQYLRLVFFQDITTMFRK